MGGAARDAKHTLTTMCIKRLAPRLYAFRKPGLSVVGAANGHVYSFNTRHELFVFIFNREAETAFSFIFES